MTGVARLVVVGSVIVDTVVEVPRLPERAGDVLATHVRSTAGGGVNVLTAAARLGLPGALAGHVGDGGNGAVVRAALAELDIPVLVRTPPGGDSGGCIVLLEPDGERTFVTAPGVESRLTPDDLATVRLRPDDAVYVSGYELLYPVSGPAIAGWLDDLRPELVVLDPGPLVAEIDPGRLAAVLGCTHVLSLNARELEQLAGTAPDGNLSALMARMAPGAVVLARAGADGAWLHDGHAVVHLPAPRVVQVDATGAGDTFIGAYLAGLADGLDPAEAGRRAAVAAALSVTVPGSATGPDAATLAAAIRPPTS